MEELKHTGRQSLQVAIIGVLAPIFLGVLVTSVLLPDLSFGARLFVAAALSATSVGITARVLKDMNQLHTRVAKTILGAAMIDDILGLIILVFVSSLVISGVIDVAKISQIIILAFLFFSITLFLGPWALQKAVTIFSFLEPSEAKLCIAFLFVMILSWLATLVELAPITGAFIAGVIIHDGFFESKDSSTKKVLSIKELLAPLEILLAPIFFMLMGIQVKIESLLDWHVLMIASGLIVAAIIGKLLSGLGGSRKDDRLLIGVGMLPRGEVALIFAATGRTLGIMHDQMFSAIILMVLVTNLIAPLWFKSRFKAHAQIT